MALAHTGKSISTTPMRFRHTEHAAAVPAAATRSARLHGAHDSLAHSVVAFAPDTKPLVEALSREVAPLK
jgi:hypothetical protein